VGFRRGASAPDISTGIRRIAITRPYCLLVQCIKWLPRYAERSSATKPAPPLWPRSFIFSASRPSLRTIQLTSARILSAYATYYNQTRTHLTLQKDAPSGRSVQRVGRMVAISILSGLHHQYARDMIFGKDRDYVVAALTTLRRQTYRRMTPCHPSGPW
jgi:hypothetical protein